MLRVGLLTSGGDCQALNATMRGIVKTLYRQSSEPVEVYGFEDGYQGLIYEHYRMMDNRDFSGLLTRGGTVLGTSRTPFKLLDTPEADGINKVEAMKHTYRKLKLDCLFMLGGNGSTKTANRLSQEGLNVIALPKTIDNDTWGTDTTFGFASSVEVATRCIDEIHTTASSHGRVFVIEIMGHKVGWIPLYAGVAGGADVILIPEIPYDMDNVVRVIEDRDKAGSRFTIVVVAEGAISKEEAALSKKEYKKLVAARTTPSIAYDIAAEIDKRTGREIRIAVPGHTQRGGQPDAQDRIFATQCGVEAALGCLEGEFGFMVAQRKGKMTRVPLKEVAGKLKYVDPEGDLVREAKYGEAPMSAEQMALAALRAQSAERSARAEADRTAAARYLADAQSDAEESGTDEVEPSPEGADEDEEQQAKKEVEQCAAAQFRLAYALLMLYRITKIGRQHAWPAYQPAAVRHTYNLL